MPAHSIAPGAPAASYAGRARLDVRDPGAFDSGHLAGSGHVPVAELRDRRGELPPRDAPVLVIAADADDARAAAGELENLGYTDVAWLDGPPAALGEPLAV